MKTGVRRGLVLTVSAAVALAWVGGIGSSATAMAAETHGPGPNGRLGRAIQEAVRADGPLFTPQEQAVINAKCGYAPGEWDGFSLNDYRGVFHCTNGRKVSDPELRALLHNAQPRISRRFREAMTRPEVKSAIGAVAEEANRHARERLAKRGWGHSH